MDFSCQEEMLQASSPHLKETKTYICFAFLYICYTTFCLIIFAFFLHRTLHANDHTFIVLIQCLLYFKVANAILLVALLIKGLMFPGLFYNIFINVLLGIVYFEGILLWV